MNRLGFGGSNLLGDKTRTQGIALLEAAYEEGIRHFDVAPAYGYGDAEALVGEFARGKRDKIRIATKFGLEPMKPLAGTGGLVNLVRKVMRTSPWVRALVRSKAPSLIKRGQFDLKFAQMSLERSLRLLNTDFIDLYLLHECTPADCSQPLLEFLQNAVLEGKIRRFGIGTEFSQAKLICTCCSQFTPLIQIKSSIVEPNLSALFAPGVASSPEARTVITHGSFTVMPKLRERLTNDPVWAERWSRILDLDLRDSESLAALVLQQALRINRKGVVLFQSGSVHRAVSNIRAAREKRLTSTQLDDFERLGAELAGNHVAVLKPVGAHA